MKKVRKRKKLKKQLRKKYYALKDEALNDFAYTRLNSIAFEQLQNNNHNQVLTYLPLPKSKINQDNLLNEFRQKYIVPLILNNGYSDPKIRHNLFEHIKQYNYVNLIGLISDIKISKHSTILIDKPSIETENGLIPVDSHLWLELNNCKGIFDFNQSEQYIKQCVLGIGDYISILEHINFYQSKTMPVLQVGVDHYAIKKWGQCYLDAKDFSFETETGDVHFTGNYDHGKDWVVKMFDIPNIACRNKAKDFFNLGVEKALGQNPYYPSLQFQTVVKPSKYLPYFKRFKN